MIRRLLVVAAALITLSLSFTRSWGNSTKRSPLVVEEPLRLWELEFIGIAAVVVQFLLLIGERLNLDR